MKGTFKQRDVKKEDRLGKDPCEKKVKDGEKRKKKFAHSPEGREGKKR